MISFRSLGYWVLAAYDRQELTSKEVEELLKIDFLTGNFTYDSPYPEDDERTPLLMELYDRKLINGNVLRKQIFSIVRL